MALFGHAAEWWHGDARINPKDIKCQFFGFEGFGGGFDRTKIIKFEGKIFKLASRQGVVHQRLLSLPCIAGPWLQTVQLYEFCHLHGTEC